MSMLNTNGWTRWERITLTGSATLVGVSLVVFSYAILTYLKHERVLAKEVATSELTVIQVEKVPTSVLKPPPEPAAEYPKLLPAPARLQIPALHIDAPVVSLGLKDDGSMEAPAKPEEVGWFKLGVPPGMTGNAVIAGHLTGRTGKPAVFIKLSTLVPGDEIKITDANGNTQRFIVSQTKSYPYDEAPMKEIFGSNPKPRLNLITCDGSWVKKEGTYNQRLVVYSELATE